MLKWICFQAEQTQCRVDTAFHYWKKCSFLTVQHEALVLFHVATVYLSQLISRVYQQRTQIMLEESTYVRGGLVNSNSVVEAYNTSSLSLTIIWLVPSEPAVRDITECKTPGCEGTELFLTYSLRYHSEKPNIQ